MLHRLGALSLRSSGKQQPESSWMTLTILSDRSLASFDMQRQLRSSVYSLQHVYALHRSVNNLDEPPRSSVQSLLTKIIIIKGGVKPPRARPLQLPTVSHPSFRNAIKTWLKTRFLSLRDYLIPFHLPQRSVVPAAHLSLSKLLVNHHCKNAEFEWDLEPPCNCQTFLGQHPQLETVRHPDDGQLHVASPLDKLRISICLKFWMGGSAKTQVYPSFQQYLENSWNQLEKWASRHFVSGINKAEWSCFLREKWKEHIPGAKLPLSIADVKFVREPTKEIFIIQGRDHAPDHLHLFCAPVFTGAFYVPHSATRTYSPVRFSAFSSQSFFATPIQPQGWPDRSFHTSLSCLRDLLERQFQSFSKQLRLSNPAGNSCKPSQLPAGCKRGHHSPTVQSGPAGVLYKPTSRTDC